MQTEDALKELKQYVIVSDIDPASQYFLGKPVICAPQIKSDDAQLKKCKLYQESKAYKPIQDYSLLIMQDGGQDLTEFAKYIQGLSESSYTTSILREFWVESLHLLKGLILFEKKGVSHHDVKPQNIVYSKSKRNARFIDFGLTRHIDYVVKLCRDDKNHMADYAFWTYPFEFAFLNRDAFMRIARMSFQEKIAYYQDIVEDLKKSKSNVSNTSLMKMTSLKFSISFKLFFNYTTHFYSDEETSEIISKYLEDFKNMILYEIVPDNYLAFLNKSVRTIDGFGYALSMQYILCYCRSHIPEYMFDDLEECFYNMMTPSVLNRYTILEGFSKMQEILKENSWLKGNRKIKNNKNHPHHDSTVHHTDLSINRETHDKFLKLQEDLGDRLMNTNK